MMSEVEREKALARMHQAIARFHSDALQIGCRPFAEFAGLMHAYLRLCQRSHADGVDFSEYNQLSGDLLHVGSIELQYIEAKMLQIFGTRSIPTSAPGTSIDSTQQQRRAQS